MEDEDEDVVRVLVATAGDDAAALDAYIDVSNQIVQMVTERYPEARVDLLSDRLRLALSDEGIRDNIMAVLRDVRMYDLVLVYIPEPHMLNAVLVWNAREHGIPVVVISQCQDHMLFAAASHVVPDLPELARLFDELKV